MQTLSIIAALPFSEVSDILFFFVRYMAFSWLRPYLRKKGELCYPRRPRIDEVAAWWTGLLLGGGKATLTISEAILLAQFWILKCPSY